MILVLDADALIKLNRLGMLAKAATVFRCLISEEVYRESVLEARIHGYPDAEDLAAVIATHLQVLNPPQMEPPEPGLGPGETSAFALAITLPGSTPHAIVSDDRQFLRFLLREEVPLLTSISVILLMVESGVVTFQDGRRALILLRPYIREADYARALLDIEQRERSQAPQ